MAIFTSKIMLGKDFFLCWAYTCCYELGLAIVIVSAFDYNFTIGMVGSHAVYWLSILFFESNLDYT